jgi:hypothetical protein
LALDRLSSFTGLIRTLWRSQSERTRGAIGAATGTESHPAEAPQPLKRTREELRDRLRSRLAGLPGAARERRCEAFVETVLLWELSDTAVADPRFAGIVARVTQELMSDPRVGARLDELFSELLSTPSP